MSEESIVSDTFQCPRVYWITHIFISIRYRRMVNITPAVFTSHDISRYPIVGWIDLEAQTSEEKQQKQ